ncbi:hypothetical protein BCV70DRAFT_104341 [Testicularia cyperi]|uniref:Uncharacterized protein n=1 Tax=Testicularia cyperi TaxID=1882483 RepID=A0A317XQ86_9BASI|nr:hypothetical protein BCV70DRAFT_104341 [Testicularia cyperi]
MHIATLSLSLSLCLYSMDTAQQQHTVQYSGIEDICTRTRPPAPTFPLNTSTVSPAPLPLPLISTSEHAIPCSLVSSATPHRAPNPPKPPVSYLAPSCLPLSNTAKLKPLRRFSHSWRAPAFVVGNCCSTGSCDPGTARRHRHPRLCDSRPCLPLQYCRVYTACVTGRAVVTLDSRFWFSLGLIVMPPSRFVCECQCQCQCQLLYRPGLARY